MNANRFKVCLPQRPYEVFSLADAAEELRSHGRIEWAKDMLAAAPGSPMRNRGKRLVAAGYVAQVSWFKAGVNVRTEQEAFAYERMSEAQFSATLKRVRASQ